MTTMTISLAQVMSLLPATFQKDVAAVRRAIQRTVQFDAHRAIQWSIQGGGWNAANGPYREPVDIGEYAASWKGYSKENGDGVFYSDASPPVKAGVIELGRREAPIPIGPLAAWVERKLGITNPRDVLSTAIAISRYAAKHRRQGLYVLERARPMISEALQDNVQEELEGVA